MIDYERAQEFDLHDISLSTGRPSGVIAIGFLLMLAGFPVFFSLASVSQSTPWFACIMALMLETAGFGLVAMTEWSRSAGIFATFFTSIVLTIRLVISFISRVPRASLDFTIYGPTMAVMGLIVAGFVILLPCLLIIGYLGSREVKQVFWQLRRNRR